MSFCTRFKAPVVRSDGFISSACYQIVDGFKFTTKASAARILAQRRAQVHERYLKLWAKKVLVSPESAVVPLNQVDYQLASKFEVRSKGDDVSHIKKDDVSCLTA